MILRCVRTSDGADTARRVVAFDEIAAALPTDTTRVSVDERASVLERRRRAVHERFAL